MIIHSSNIKKRKRDITIWHYTSPEVLWKMLSGEFYATHYRFMNDSAEIVYGIQEIDTFLKKHEQTLQYLQFVIKDLQKRDFFLLCFSKHKDDLYHWRSYTPHGGYSIGLSYNRMCDLFNNLEYDSKKGEITHCDLVQCRYLSPDGITNFMCKTTADFNCAIEKLSPDEKLLFEQSVAQTKSGHFSEALKLLYDKSPKLIASLKDIFSLAFRIQAQCPGLKHPSFKLENEYRLIITGDSGDDLRTRIEFVGNKPRIKIPSPLLPKCIKGIYVSPHGDVEQNYLLAEIAKKRFGLNFNIHQSKSTFNGK